MATLPFSETFSSGDLVFVSGQVPLDAKGKMMKGSIEDLTHQTMKNVKKVLKDAGLNFTHVVMTYIYLTDLKNMKKVSDINISYFKEPYPARVTLGVASLPLDSKIEICVIASKK